MGQPGRRKSSESEWKLEFIRRVKQARERTGMTQTEFAAKLQELSGRNVPYDTYRKYELEDPKKGSLLRHDLIYSFCELTKIHVAALLEGGGPFTTAPRQSKQEKRHAA